MHTDYLNQLISCLHATQVYRQDGIAYKDYEEAMAELVGLFSEIKKMESRSFLLATAGAQRLPAI